MIRLRYTLLCDGSSDRMLFGPIRWSLRKLGVEVERESWADLRNLQIQSRTLQDRINCACEFYPCDLMIVHRDSENVPYQDRVEEVRTSFQSDQIFVPLVPVRMTESWFLSNIDAIRIASGNPNGTSNIVAIVGGKVEDVSNPKALLFDLLKLATGLSGRRLEKRLKSLPSMRLRVSDVIDDYSYLMQVPAFVSFYRELERAIRSLEIK